MQGVVSAVVLCDLLDEFPEVPALLRITVSGSRAHRRHAGSLLQRVRPCLAVRADAV